jgi:hypothetical protein
MIGHPTHLVYYSHKINYPSWGRLKNEEVRTEARALIIGIGGTSQENHKLLQPIGKVHNQNKGYFLVCLYSQRDRLRQRSPLERVTYFQDVENDYSGPGLGARE